MFFRRLLLLAAALLTAACSSKQPAVPPRYAVLRFENLTPDPALNWMGRAASEILAREIGAIPASAIYKANEPFGRRPVSAPGVSTEFSDALLAGANRIVTGYFEQVNGKFSFTAQEEDARTGKTLAASAVQGSLLDACAALARKFTATPKPYPTQNVTALRDFMLGLESSPPNGNFYELAVAADPKFADAYLAWSESALSRGDPELMGRILSEAKAHNLDGIAMAKLELAAATVDNNAEGRVSALRRLVQADPNDLSAIQALGDSEMLAHHFPEAAAAFAKGASGSRPDLLNLKAYALMFGGDEKGALAAVDDYQKARPQDPNAIDTAGDIQFYFGHFGDAEKAYLRSAAKDPNFNQGGEIWKAARARLMTGDVAAATQIFDGYRKDREKAKDASVPFRAACWTFLSGGESAAIDAMQKVAESASSENLKTLALAQAAIWELQLGRKADAIRDADAVIKAGQTPNLISAALIRFAAQDAPSPAELRIRADRMFNGAMVEQLRPLAVGYALFFAKRYTDAAPVWKQLYVESNPNDQAAAFLYAGALQESGHENEAAALLKGNPLPSANLSPSFECLYFPKLFEWRGDHATYLKLVGNTAAPPK